MSDGTYGVVYGRSKRKLTREDPVRSNLPKALWHTKVDGIQDPKVREVVRGYIENIQDRMTHGDGLIITGDEGVGKSGVAALIVKAAIRWNYSAYFITHGEMQLLLEKDREFADGMTILERVETVDLLVLDNFNNDLLNDKRFSAFSATDLEKIIARRVGDRRTTILTTRFSAANFREHDELIRLRSVMKESMVGIKIAGVDLRDALGDAARKRVLGES